MIDASNPNADAPWSAAPAGLSLPPEEIHVWRAALTQTPQRLARLEALLSDDELQRAARFRFEDGRAHYVTARGILRALLGGYLGRDPRGLAFTYGPNGKPELMGHEAPRCNISHSHGTALFAMALNRRVGVDLERVRSNVEDMAIAERFFSPAEAAALRELGPTERLQAFFRCWTRKEAYIKAKGGSVAMLTNRFDVSVDESPALLTTRDDPADAARWTLRDIPMDSEYAAAVAGEGTGWALRLWDVPDDIPFFSR
jgi:4'-phosphopantetheinyl transferase